MRIKHLLYSTLWNKCPKCHKSDVFVSKNPFNLKHFTEMNESCSCCDEKYEKEPGGYYGAMYVSYALMVGWFVICWVIDSFFLHTETIVFLAFVISSIVLYMPLTFRISRLLWLNFFIKFDQSISTSETKI
jgi:uncharacterized protein (DUF983 family)